MNRRFLTIVALVLSWAIAEPAIGTAAGATLPTSSRLTYHFTNCRGPSGTPTTFDAVKQPGGAAALHLLGGGGTFVAMEAIDLATGEVLFTTRGFERNGLALVTCRAIHPVTQTLQQISGIITAAK